MDGVFRARCGALLCILLASVLLLGLALRIEFTRLAPPFMVGNDSVEYLSAGLDLAAEGDFDLEGKRTPLYSFFLAGLIKLIGPSLDGIIAAQHAFGLLTVLLSFTLGALAFGRAVGVLTALGVALSGDLLTMEQLLISEVVFAPLLVASCAAILFAVRSDHPASWLLAGLLMGLGSLARPLGFLVPAVVLLSLPFIDPRQARRARGATLLLLGCAACLAPWLVRQAFVYERPEINGGLGDSLYSRVRRYDRGLDLAVSSERLSESERVVQSRIAELAPTVERPRSLRRQLRSELGITNDEADRALRSYALSIIAQNPLRYVEGTALMVGRLIRGSSYSVPELWASMQREVVLENWPADYLRTLATDRPIASTSALERSERLTSLYRDDRGAGILVLVLAPIGAVLAVLAHRRRGTAIIPLIILSQFLLYAALNGPVFRYRYPFQPLITMLGAAGLVYLVQQLAPLWTRLRSLRARPSETASS
jgi:hypothetical protein